GPMAFVGQCHPLRAAENANNSHCWATLASPQATLPARGVASRQPRQPGEAMTTNLLLPSTVALAAACLCQPCWAQSREQAQTLPEVRVRAGAVKETATSPVIGYRAKNAATATKTDTPLSQTPQAITV